ncbi:MAG: hypothetical protein ACTSX7_08635 [Alphaproteobacteria bacterium]
MANDKCVGIHYSSTGITAVIAEKHGTAAEVLERVTVPVETGASTEPEVPALAQLADQLRRHEEKMPPAALAVAGAFYQSQFHHSEFAEAKQLAQTLRFDVEEEFMIEAESAAICYQRLPTAGAGSELIVHIANREHMAGLLPHFDEAGLDALLSQPDLAAWLTYLKHQEQLPADEPILLLAWVAGTVYLLILDRERQPVLARSYHCDSAEHAQATLVCELLRSLALLSPDQKPTAIFYHADGFSDEQIEQVSQATKLTCRPLSEPKAAEAFALGAALAWFDEDTTADFRGDRLPPRSLITAKRKGLFGLSGAICVLLLVMVIVLKAHQGRYESTGKEAQEAAVVAWKQTNPAQRRRSTQTYSSLLKRRLNELKARSRTQATQSLPTSTGHILMLLLQQLDTLPADFALRIKAVNINVKAGTATLTGSVPALEDMDKLVAVFTDTESPLKYVTWEFDTGGSGKKGDVTNKVAFTMPLRVKRDSKKKSNRTQ